MAQHDALLDALMTTTGGLPAAIATAESRWHGALTSSNETQTAKLSAVDAKYRDLGIAGLRLKWWSAIILIAGIVLATWPDGIVAVLGG